MTLDPSTLALKHELSDLPVALLTSIPPEQYLEFQTSLGIFAIEEGAIPLQFRHEAYLRMNLFPLGTLTIETSIVGGF